MEPRKVSVWQENSQSEIRPSDKEREREREREGEKIKPPPMSIPETHDMRPTGLLINVTIK